jgi:hypothetical protein
MRHTVLAAVFALSVSAVLSLGCGSGAPPSANSFTEVYTGIIQPKCSNDFCHFNGVGIRFSALDLSSKARAYWSLVGQPCMGPNCQQRGMRVVPGQPDTSIMYLKLLDQMPSDTTMTRCGNQMPLDMTTFRTNGISEFKFSGPTLPADQQQRIHDWIQEGAQDN